MYIYFENGLNRLDKKYNQQVLLAVLVSGWEKKIEWRNGYSNETLRSLWDQGSQATLIIE